MSEGDKKLPDQTVFHVIKIAGREKGIWNKIGVTYKHKDGKGVRYFLITFSCVKTLMVR